MEKQEVSIAEINATLDRMAKASEEMRIESQKSMEALKKAMEDRDKAAEAKEKAAAAKEKALEKLVASIEAQVQKTFGGLEDVRSETRGIGESNGMFSESYFYNSLYNSMSFGGIDFDEIDKSFTKAKKLPDGTKIKGEYDIVLNNKDTVVIIEIKYRARKGDATDLINRKLVIFKQLFPEYANHKFYLGLGGMSFDEGAENDALNHGVGILRPKGESVEIVDTHLIAY